MSELKIQEETKTKFDLLLKQALNMKSRKNVQNLAAQKSTSIESLTNTINENKSTIDNTLENDISTTAVVEVDVHEDATNDNFILNKFLNDSTNLMANENTLLEDTPKSETYRKPPVPRPRKHKKGPSSSSSVSSTGTYVLPPKLLPETQKIDTIELAKADDNINSSKEQLLDETVQIKYVNEIKLKRKHKSSRRRDVKHDSSSEDILEVALNETMPKYNYEEIMGITVYKTDRLKLDSLIVHPVVKIHVVDIQTGEYIRKSDANRAAVYFYEDKSTTRIIPIISEPYNLYENRSLFPQWEETLIINEDIKYMLESNTIIFFEILDFVTFSQVKAKESSKGWRKIAWAFLKVLGKNDALNTNQRIRLQLYNPAKYNKLPPFNCPLFHWWAKKKLQKYPSSLYVNIQSIKPPEIILETLRSKTPIQGERASNVTFTIEINSESDLLENKSDKILMEEKTELINWSRLINQSCKLPNTCVAELWSYDEGCLTLQFSNDGLYLACAVLIDNTHYIIIVSVKTFEEECKYSIHQGLIYDIKWSQDDNYIITASADCTVCIWSFKKRKYIEMLPHPSYVYSNIFCGKFVATGCYDHVVRLWSETNKGNYQLNQELEGHKGYITSLCCTEKNTHLFSSDSIGVIIEWKTNNENWYLKREIRLIDLRNTVINQILLNGKEKRLVINARDDTIRVVDLKTECVLHWLHGTLNTRFKTTCTISPCNNYILAGSENGKVIVWNTDSGQIVATYTPYEALNAQNATINSLQFHPYDNIIAMSHYGRNLPILLAAYDRNQNVKNTIGLKMLQNVEVLNLKKRNDSVSCRSDTPSTKEFKELEKSNKSIKFENILEKIDQLIIINQQSSCGSSKETLNNS